MDNNTSSLVQQLSPDVTFEQSGKLIMYTMTKASREAVDAFIDHALNVYRDYPTDKPMYLLVDTLATGTSSLSPYFRKRIEELTALAVSRDLKVFVAVILPKSYMIQLAMFFVQKLDVGTSQIRMFFAREKGIEWLESKFTEA